MTEYDMVQAVADFLCESHCQVAINVPFMNQCIDLVYINTNNELVAVEFKLHDWKRAVQQSRTHLLGADRVYICIPCRAVTDELSESLTTHGIGLFFYDTSNKPVLTEQIAAEPVSSTFPFTKEWLRAAFTKHRMEDHCWKPR